MPFYDKNHAGSELFLPIMTALLNHTAIMPVRTAFISY
jgi:hypothetical protein